MKFYHIDSFTLNVFGGNPAGVLILGENWLEDDLMQKIAEENNMSETAFAICKDGKREIRWFTPTSEVLLCGHATLATAHALFNHEKVEEESLVFDSKSGIIKVIRKNGMYELDFPVNKTEKIDLSENIDVFNYKPIEILKGSFDYLFIFDSEEKIKDITYDYEKLKNIDLEGIIVSSKSDKVDFVARYFGPKIGIDEDPVTGSAQTLMVPYWHRVTGKTSFVSKQISKRGGTLYSELAGNRVKIAGHAVTYLVGDIIIGE